MAKPKTSGEKVIARNRRARFDYDIDQTIEAGLVLRGTEVKSLRAGKVSLGEGYVRIEHGEAWLCNVHINEYSHGNIHNHEPLRTRKLLLHSREIDRLTDKIRELGTAAVPLELYFLKGRVKVLIGVGKGRRKYDKRQHSREKTDRREMDRY